MKRYFILTVFICLCLSVAAQSVSISFTGRDANNQYVQLDRITITNLTHGWQETLLWPDTVLTIVNSSGIGDIEGTTTGVFLQLSQNSPNPFAGTTDVLLNVPNAGRVTLEITDMNGHMVIPATDISSIILKNELSLQHQFRITLSTAGIYVLTARQNGKSSSIKMINHGGGNRDGIDYTGDIRTNDYIPRQICATVTHPFNAGDQMEYVGYATINGNLRESRIEESADTTSHLIVIAFSEVQHTLPTVITDPVSEIGSTWAFVSGAVTDDGGASVFERGFCYGTSPAPTLSDSLVYVGSGTGSFTDILGGLSAETTYYLRAFATNSIGTAYGNSVSFTTAPEFLCGIDTITDASSHSYHTVLIGSQCWMKENLRTICYATTESIQYGGNVSYGTNAPRYYYPGNNVNNVETYGLLYNWYAVMNVSGWAEPTSQQGICPDGWHVPSDLEWQVLEETVGMSPDNLNSTGYRDTIGGILSGDIGWQEDTIPNSPGNYSDPNHNRSGFSALPAGNTDSGVGSGADFWTSSTYTNSEYAYDRWIASPRVGRFPCSKEKWFSVRCIKD